MILKTNQVHELDIALQQVVRKVANGYAADNIDTGGFFIKYHIPRGSDLIEINIMKRKFYAKVQDRSS